MLGYCSVGNPWRNTTPTMTMKMAMTMATMGRLTKKSPMADHFLLASLGVTCAMAGLTVAPSRAFCRPS